ncbi:E3 ubiquitin-protein ligase TRIM39-like [Spea bombifrons]|uniref:E3 ubiquitin-protein ligase TRIM39-like n=1 Tax=Spea bombifrons TaxID=233779 RepID=UPI00234B04B9|nr:E3 ubiquitin-protein ligase TRIM39-like [Spea bombifrons]
MAFSDPNPIKDLQEELTCPICLDNFNEPVSIECGHSFCRPCIVRTWRGIHSNFPCPQCRKTSKWKFLRPNRLVENMVEITNRLLVAKINDVYGKTCKKHQEPVKLYCHDDDQEICLVCRESVFHKTHNVIPLEEATRDFKGHLKEKLQSLKREVDNIVQSKSDEQQKSQNLQCLVGQKRRVLASEFECLRQLLADHERDLNDRLEKMEKTIIQRRNESITRFNEKLAALQKSIADIEKNGLSPSCQKHQPKQELKSTVSRPSHEPQFTNCSVSSTLERLKMYTVSVTLDQKTANPNLFVSGNRKLVRYEEYPRDVIPYPERFDTKPCVLGITGYKIGKRYWEVEVGGGIYWSVGVAKQSVCRKGFFKIDPHGGIWAIGLLGMYADCYYAFTNPDILLYPREHPVRIGVLLNCEEHYISFYNADTMELLHTFASVQSADKLFPFFCVGAMGTEVRLD